MVEVNWMRQFDDTVFGGFCGLGNISVLEVFQGRGIYPVRRMKVKIVARRFRRLDGASII